MITGLANVLTNHTLVNIAQNTNGTVISKTLVNSIGRPGFILIDKNIDDDTKKFAATKEFLYQMACLIIYLALIVPVFKNGAFKLAKKYIYKGAKGFSKFNSAAEYLEYRKIAEKTLSNRKASLGKDYFVFKLNHDGLKEDLLTKITPQKYNHVKGAIELGNLVGSIVGLAILAPQISQGLTHAFLRFTGLEKEKAGQSQNK